MAKSAQVPLTYFKVLQCPLRFYVDGCHHHMYIASLYYTRDLIVYFTDSTVAGGPIGGQTKVSLRNEHLTYILTWLVCYSLLCNLICLLYRVGRLV